MISFIICSVKPEMAKALSANIGATVGCDYEVLIEDNRNLPRGICEAYNEGAAMCVQKRIVRISSKPIMVLSAILMRPLLNSLLVRCWMEHACL